ncbi:MAG: molybdenum transporter substrate-binding protein [Rhizobium sp.]|nr:molybdenum transporter substrate-binding protein [Rhizobium sp.]
MTGLLTLRGRMYVGYAAVCAAFFWLLNMNPAAAVELKILTAGAFKHFPIAMAQKFEKQSGHTSVIDNDTAGGLVKRIGGGEAFDVAFVSRAAADTLMAGGRIAPGTRIEIGKIGVGVVVREGVPVPAVDSVDAFKQALLGAKSISYPDPASGGSAGIYAAGLIQRLGLADQVGPKTRLISGDVRLIDPVVKGEVELGIYPVAEIMATAGARLAGPLPEEIQNYTTYVVVVSKETKHAEAASGFVQFVSGPSADAVLTAQGMVPVRR